MINSSEQIRKSNGKFGYTFFGGVSKLMRIFSIARSEYQWRAERHRSRMQLLQMDDHLLRDIGVTRGDAMKEASRDFWD